jgi:uncharacterized protein
MDTRSKPNYEKILKNLKIDKSSPSILLKHSPDSLDVAEKNGISLQLSGHSHHGQIFPFSLVTSLFYKGYDYGLHHLKNLTIYTSSGVGTWGPPSRVGTKAEIVLLKFVNRP